MEAQFWVLHPGVLLGWQRPKHLHCTPGYIDRELNQMWAQLGLELVLQAEVSPVLPQCQHSTTFLLNLKSTSGAGSSILVFHVCGKDPSLAY